MIKIIDKRELLSKLISPRRDFKRPIYNWHSFKHSYSKELVDTFIKEFELKKGAWVLDPFCGGGTTLLASKQAGLNSHGYDILPFSVFLSNVKTDDFDLQRIKEVRKTIHKIDRSINTSFILPSISIAQKAFRPKIEEQLYQIKERVNIIDDISTRNFFNLAFLSILELVSNTSKTGGFLRIVNNKFIPDKVWPTFLNRVDAMIKDVEQSKISLQKNVTAKAFRGDARKINSEIEYNAIITSPPYPNRHDYTRIYALELMFDFVKSNEEIKQIRYETLRSHVEARKKYEAENYIQPKPLNKLIKQIKKNGVNNSKVTEMLEGYFEDMYLVLSQMKRRLKKQGKIALVVSNVRFSGVNIPVDQLLANIGEQTGLKTKGIWLARNRGNSAQQVNDYKRKPSRESIIIWGKN